MMAHRNFQKVATDDAASLKCDSGQTDGNGGSDKGNLSLFIDFSLKEKGMLFLCWAVSKSLLSAFQVF